MGKAATNQADKATNRKSTVKALEAVGKGLEKDTAKDYITKVGKYLMVNPIEAQYVWKMMENGAFTKMVKREARCSLR